MVLPLASRVGQLRAARPGRGPATYHQSDGRACDLARRYRGGTQHASSRIGLGKKPCSHMQWIDYISSYTKPGEANPDGAAEGSNPPSGSADQWYQVQEDLRHPAHSAAGYSGTILQ